MADIADSAGAKLVWAAETTWGTNPTTGFTYLRFTSDSLEQNTDTTESAEVTADREPRGAVRTATRASGGINFEFTADTFDTVLEHALMSAFTADIAKSAQSIDITNDEAALGTATLTDTASANAFNSVVAGQWLKLAGFTAAADNGYTYVAAKASANAVTAYGLAFVDEAGQTDIAITGQMLRIGTTKKSMSIERQWTTLTTPT